MDKECDKDDNKLINRINDCLNIENNIKNIIEINYNIGKCYSEDINIQFFPEEDNINELEETIKKFGDISGDYFHFKFKQEIIIIFLIMAKMLQNQVVVISGFV